MTTAPTWLVLGASSAIARAFAREAARDGAAVILAGRDRADLERSAADLRTRFGVAAEVRDFDARDYDGHAALAEEMAGRGGLLNVFLAFGAMPDQAVCDSNFAQTLLSVETNYLGAVSLLQRLAPLLERQGQGRVVVFGSVAGDRGRLKNYVYGSAKAGLHAYLQGLRARLFRAGVSVTTVKPGFVDTAMTFGLDGMFLVAAPGDVARAAYRAAAKGREMVYLPGFWRLIMMIITHIPERVFKRLSI